MMILSKENERSFRNRTKYNFAIFFEIFNKAVNSGFGITCDFYDFRRFSNIIFP
jgi:hypothetical protein